MTRAPSSQSQERWDVVLRFTTGPLGMQGDVVCRGPVVRMGANPGPGGLRLEGYRALDDRQAVITAYDGGSVSIAPVGQNQVRLGPHENVEWAEVPPIQGPKYLSPGEAFHLGPPDRGATCVFVESRRLGVWEQQRILSEAAQADPQVQPTQVKDLDVRRRVPGWFIPAMISVALATVVGVSFNPIYKLIDKPPLLGVQDEGSEKYEYVDTVTRVDPELVQGFEQAFADFVMVPNAEAAEWKELSSLQGKWDDRLLEYVTRSAKAHGQGRRFWMRLEDITDDYAYVLGELREAGLPEVFAAIPYWESSYRAEAQSFLCAQGYWQLMPEVAFRMDLEVRDCKLRGSDTLWSPVDVVPATNVKMNAPYVDSQAQSCRMQGCAVDERKDLQRSTRAAVALLGEAWDDPALRASGAAVQLSILSHHAGYDDSRYLNGKEKRTNIRTAYLRHLAATGKQDRATTVYGDNIKCGSPKDPDWCGSVFDPATQHYGYNIIAEHLLAVCYYATNYDDLPVFSPWKDYVVGDGYCLRIEVPTTEQVKKWSGNP